jgi:DNA invertase Pin-like site-specific DNA recombinase
VKAIYIRTSSDDQKPENQITDIEKISGKEYSLYKDQQSAWKDTVERDAFNSLLKEIKERKITDLYVWDIDRIYRNRAKLLGFFEMCKMYGCNVWSYRQGFLNEIQQLTLPKGFEFIKEMMINNFLQFLGWIAEDESNKKSDRVKAAIRVKEDGIYSYKGNKWGRDRISTYKKNLIAKLRSEGKSIRDIAKEAKLSIGVVHKYIHMGDIQKTK